MKRVCLIIRSASEYGSPFKRHLCIDLENEQAIYECIEAKRKKFWQIIERTLTQPNIYWDCYAKETVSSATKKIAAIKFFDLDNTRIYCQEVSGLNGNFYIVCAVVLLSKKVQKNDKRIDNILESISKYEYEIR